MQLFRHATLAFCLQQVLRGLVGPAVALGATILLLCQMGVVQEPRVLRVVQYILYRYSYNML